MHESTNAPDLEQGLAVIGRRWPGLVNTCQEEPVFVFAAGWRSGSTLLQRALMPPCFIWGEPFGHADLIDSLADHLRCFTDVWPEPHFFHQGEKPDVLARQFIANLYPGIGHLLAAHQDFLLTLFAKPARETGASLGTQGGSAARRTCSLPQMALPAGQVPLSLPQSLRCLPIGMPRRAAGWQWFKTWPDEPVTTRCFGSHWRTLVSDFLDGHQKVAGRLVRFEDLVRGDFAGIEDYLGFPLWREALGINPSDGGPPPLTQLPDAERVELEKEVGELAARLGYFNQGTSRPVGQVGVPPSGGEKVFPHEGSPSNDPPLPGSPDIPLPAEPKIAGRCVILIPVAHHIEHACELALRQLELKGYEVRRVPGYAAIDQRAARWPPMPWRPVSTS